MEKGESVTFIPCTRSTAAADLVTSLEDSVLFSFRSPP